MMSLQDELKRNEGFQLFERLVEAAEPLVNHPETAYDMTSEGHELLARVSDLVEQARIYLGSLPTLD